MNTFTGCFGATAVLIMVMITSCKQYAKRVGQNASEASTKAELETIDRQLAVSYVKGNPDSLVGFFDSAFTYLPEYRPPFYERNNLQQFFKNWLASVPVSAYQKRIYSAESIGPYVLEVGHFELSYVAEAGATRHYTGKYMTMWKRDASGRLKILSDAFGSDKPINPEDMPYARVSVKESHALVENELSPELRPEIEAFDQAAIKAILGGDGQARAREFTEDGIYMPHFDPMQVGMNMIQPYMVKTYKPGIINYVKDTYREIFNADGFVFLSGHFSVAFDNGSTKGSFEGNMSNLMKRGRDGKLLMYRQLAHN